LRNVSSYIQRNHPNLENGITHSLAPKLEEKQMPLDQNQTNIVQQHLQKNRISAQCPACNSVGNWGIGELIMAPTFAAGGIALGSGVPEVQVICTKCGFILHFAAKVVGLDV
jgi:hypothetical protein